MKKADAIKYFGSQKIIAETLGIARSAVSQWGEEVPPLRAFQLERLSDGNLKPKVDVGKICCPTIQH